MTDLALRPLTLGEILDRTFSLYRQNFLLFIGIAAVPQIIVLAFKLTNVATVGTEPRTIMVTIALGLVSIVIGMAALVFSQGGTVVAVSEIYLGRTVTIAEAMGRAWENFGRLLGVVILSTLKILLFTLLLVIPGIYMGCRLLVCVPAAVIEGKSSGESLARSTELTRGFLGRAFLILLLAIAIGMAAGILFAAPFGVAIAMSLGDPARVRFWTQMTQIGTSVASTLVTPISLIASSIFYYDLRVRKEAFDLQIMMNPGSEAEGGTTGSLSIS